MKRYLPFLVALPLIAAGYACSQKGSDDPNNPDGVTPGEGEPGGPGGPGDPNGPGGEDLGRNPIEGIEPAKPILETGAFTDGPVWHTEMGVLFFTTPLGEGGLFRMLPDGRVLQVREGVRELGTTPIGNAVAKNGDLITVEMRRIVRGHPSPDAGGGGEPVVVATGFTGAADPDAGTGAGGGFDTLNDAVVRDDGTIYVTDPGYFAEPMANRIYRVAPDGQVTVVEAFEDVPRPNGIALSPDQSTLYVGFTQPLQGTLPFIRQYIVNEDGTLGEWTKFVDIGPEDSTPDGLAVDKAGNVYVAVQGGIEVFKADGSKIGKVEVPEKPTGCAFGGKDLRTLYITTEGTKIYELRLNVPGIAQ
jgi:gluconolactonase